jgi:hypothetical protein
MEPADPMDRIEPAEPMERTDPAEPSDRIDSADAMDHTDPKESGPPPVTTGTVPRVPLLGRVPGRR